MNDLDHPQVFVADTLAGVGLGAPQMVIQGAADNLVDQVLPGVEVPTVPTLPVPDIAAPAVPHVALPALSEVTLPQMTVPQADIPGLLQLGGLTAPEPVSGDPLTVVPDTLVGLGSSDPREVLDGTLHDLDAGGAEDTVNQTLNGLGAGDVLHTVSDATAGLGLF